MVYVQPYVICTVIYIFNGAHLCNQAANGIYNDLNREYMKIYHFDMFNGSEKRLLIINPLTTTIFYAAGERKDS